MRPRCYCRRRRCQGAANAPAIQRVERALRESLLAPPSASACQAALDAVLAVARAWQEPADLIHCSGLWWESEGELVEPGFVRDGARPAPAPHVHGKSWLQPKVKRIESRISRVEPRSEARIWLQPAPSSGSTVLGGKGEGSYAF